MKSDREYRQMAELEWEETHDQISDVYEAQDENGEWTVPMIEWDGPWGRHSIKYDSPELRAAVIERHDLNTQDWIEDRISRLKKADNIVNHIHSKPTIGDAYPELKKLIFGNS